jgi:WD40 repeat protein
MSDVGVRIRSNADSEESLQFTASCSAVHNAQPLLAVAGLDQTLRLMRFDADAESAAPFSIAATLPLPDTVTAVAWRDDLLLAALYNGVVCAFRVAGTQLSAGTRRRAPIKLDDADRIVSTIGRVTHPLLFDVPVPPPTPGVFMRSSRVAAVGLHPSTPQRFLTLENCSLHVWDLLASSASPPHKLTGHATAVLPQPLLCGAAPALCAQWSPHCADVVLVGGRARTLSLLDLRQRRAEAWRATPAHDGAVVCLRASPLIPHWVASGGSDGYVRIWDLRAVAQPIVELGAHEGSVESVDWSPCYANVLASGGRDRLHQVWSLQSATPIPAASKLWNIDDSVATGDGGGAGSSAVPSSSSAAAAAASSSSLSSSKKSAAGARPWTETNVLAKASLFGNDKFHEPLLQVAFFGGALALRGASIGVASSGELQAVEFENERLFSHVGSRYEEDADGHDVERLLLQRKLDTAFTRAFGNGRRTAREADLAARRGAVSEALRLRHEALAALQLCYQCAAPESDPLRFRRHQSGAGADENTGAAAAGVFSPLIEIDNLSRQAIQQARRRFIDELNQYAYFLPPNVPRYSEVADATTLSRVAILRLVLEVRIFAALGNAEALLEREADVLDALERDLTAVPRAALSAIITCVMKHQSLSTAIAMCQRLEAPLTKDKRPRKAYAALVHTVLKPTVYDETKESKAAAAAAAAAASAAAAAATGGAPAPSGKAEVVDGEMESDDASEMPDDGDAQDPLAAKRAADRKKKRQLDKFVRELLTEAEADTQLKFMKRFSKRIETDDPDALAFAVANKPRIVLSATANDQILELALRARRFDVLYPHTFVLMAVIEGYPYHSQLAHFVFESFDELDRFIERAVGAANEDRCALLCDMLCQLAVIIESSSAMPKPLFDKCVGGLSRGATVLAQSHPDPAHVGAALERMRASNKKKRAPAVAEAVKALESFSS